MRILVQIGFVALITACGSFFDSGPLAPAAAPLSASPVFLQACAAGARPQTELDWAGLPPLVPTSPTMRCLLNAVGGSTYDGGYNFVIQLTDGRVLQIYERRGGRPVKEGASQAVPAGSRELNGVQWTWAKLANGATILEATTSGVYVELSAGGNDSQIDMLAEIARSLRPVEAVPRPSAREICSALSIGPNPYVVAAAFDTHAASIVGWEETAPMPVGMRVVSTWRNHPATEPVAVCYLDGDFGAAKGPAPLPGSAATPLPNWDRVVYLVGAERRPIAVIFGWQDRIPIRDPGP
jgi:hypothetical protein